MSLSDEKLLTKEEHLANYIKTFVAIEDAMEPFKEQRKDLRESYDENGWLSKEEMRLAVKAYRLYKKRDESGKTWACIWDVLGTFVVLQKTK